MNDLNEMQSFEVENFKINFNQPPNLIQRDILKLPLEKQQYWIDLWMETPEVRASIERKRNQEQDTKTVQAPINAKGKPKPDQHWQD